MPEYIEGDDRPVRPTEPDEPRVHDPVVSHVEHDGVFVDTLASGATYTNADFDPSFFHPTELLFPDSGYVNTADPRSDGYDGGYEPVLLDLVIQQHHDLWL
jgi:hypothetical protein